MRFQAASTFQQMSRGEGLDYPSRFFLQASRVEDSVRYAPLQVLYSSTNALLARLNQVRPSVQGRRRLYGRLWFAYGVMLITLFMTLQTPGVISASGRMEEFSLDLALCDIELCASDFVQSQVPLHLRFLERTQIEDVFVSVWHLRQTISTRTTPLSTE